MRNEKLDNFNVGDHVIVWGMSKAVVVGVGYLDHIWVKYTDKEDAYHYAFNPINVELDPDYPHTPNYLGAGI